MKHYFCLLCGVDLGEFVEGGEEPFCPDHPHMPIELRGVEDVV